MQISESGFAVLGLGYSPPWSVNAGFVVGEHKTLIIDTGATALAAQTIHGYAKSVRPKNRLLVFNTEPHFDHIGGNSYFRRLGLDIYGHPDIKRTAEAFKAEKAEFNEGINHRARAAMQEAEAFFIHTELANPTLSALAGASFDVGGIVLEVLATPGHTKVNQSIFNRAEGVLFCADCIVSDYVPNLEAGDLKDWHAWLDSLAKIEALKPAVVVPGHGRVIRGHDVEIELGRMRRFLLTAIKEGRAPTL